MELWSAEWICMKGRFERDWGVVVDEEGVIQAVGPRQQLVARARTVHHYPNRIMMPTFANPHHHGFHRAFRGVGDFEVAFDELIHRLIWPVSKAMDGELIEAVYRVAFAELAQSGVSAVGEFHYLHNGALKLAGEAHFAERIIQAALDVGIRLTLVYAFFDQGSSDQAGAFIQPLHVGQEEFDRLHAQYAAHPLVNIVPGIHSLEHTSPEAILAAAELAEKYDTPLHIQLAEREDELKSARTQYDADPLTALERIGVLDRRLVIINGTLLDDEALQKVRQKCRGMVLCPSSALARGDDMPNLWGVLREDIPFAVGSDSLAMNYTYLPPEEVRLIELTLRGLHHALNVLGSREEGADPWALVSSASASLLGVQQMQLMPGSPADMMLIEPRQPYLKPPENASGAHYLNQLLHGWGAAATVTHLMVQGRMVVRNGQSETDLRTPYQKLQRWNEAFLRSIRKSSGKPTDDAVSKSAS